MVRDLGHESNVGDTGSAKPWIPHEDSTERESRSFEEPAFRPITAA
jgi:hypothetical protein